MADPQATPQPSTPASPDFSDLGAVPAQQAAKGPDFSDLGAVPAQTSQAPAPDWRDKLQESVHNGYLNDLGLKPGASQADIDAAEAKTPLLRKLAHHAALHAVSSAINVATHPLDTIGSAAQQAFDAANLGAGTYMGTSEAIPGVGSRERLANTIQQTIKQAKEDPSALLGDLLGQSAVAEPLAGAAGAGLKMTGKVLSKTGDIAAAGAEETGRMLTNTNASDTRALVRTTADRNIEAQAAADKANASLKAAHDAETKAVNAQNAQARQIAQERSVQLHQQAVNDMQAQSDLAAQHHAEEVQDIVQQNSAAQDAADKANAAASEQALNQHAQDVEDAADVESKRGQLARKAIEYKNRLAQHVQDYAATVRDSLNDRFDAVRDKIATKGTGDAPVAPLSDAAAAETSRLGETGDKVNQFKSIVDKAQVDATTDELRDILSNQHFEKNYTDLSDFEKQGIDEAVKEQNPETIEPSTITYGQLRRISSKLGSQAFSLRDSDPFIASSIKNVKQVADAMAQKMAEDAGVGTEHKKLMKDWSTYKSVFKEPTGPSGSGSQVAQSLNAEDAAHATAPFLSDDPLIASRAKQLLTGSAAEGPYYNPKGGRLVDALRKVQDQQAALPNKPVEVAPFEQPKQIVPKLAEVPSAPTPATGTPIDPLTGRPTTRVANVVQPGQEGTPPLQPQPELKPENPEPETITPQSLEQGNRKNVLNTIDRFRNASAYRVGSMIAGTVGLASSIAGMLGDAIGAGGHERGLLIGGGLSLVAAMGPRIISRILESDKVLAQLSKPTIAQFNEVKKLPPELRPGVEKAISDLTDTAIQSGKIQGPNRWKALLNTASQNVGGRSQTPIETGLTVAPQPSQGGNQQ